MSASNSFTCISIIHTFYVICIIPNSSDSLFCIIFKILLCHSLSFAWFTATLFCGNQFGDRYLFFFSEIVQNYFSVHLFLNQRKLLDQVITHLVTLIFRMKINVVFRSRTFHSSSQWCCVELFLANSFL